MYRRNKIIKIKKKILKMFLKIKVFLTFLLCTNAQDYYYDTSNSGSNSIKLVFDDDIISNITVNINKLKLKLLNFN
jgi:hypothetical protein